MYTPSTGGAAPSCQSSVRPLYRGCGPSCQSSVCPLYRRCGLSCQSSVRPLYRGCGPLMSVQCMPPLQGVRPPRVSPVYAPSTGGAALDLKTAPPKPCKWILDMTWLNLVELRRLTPFNEILNQVATQEKSWKAWFDKDAPEAETIPDGYSSTLDTFRKLLLIR